jgi:hypothetical protein
MNLIGNHLKVLDTMSNFKTPLVVFCSILGGAGLVVLLQNNFVNKPQPEVNRISLDSIREAEEVDQTIEPDVKNKTPAPTESSQKTVQPRTERNAEPSTEPTPVPERETQRQPRNTPKTIWVPVVNDTYTVDLPTDKKGYQNGVFFYDPITMIDHQGHTRQGFTPDCKFWYNPNADRRVPNPGLACKVVLRTQTQY